MNTNATPPKHSPADLEHYFAQVQSIILSRQNPISGLLPASTAITNHGDYTDAWVRDNVYSILAPWGLAMAFRRHKKSASRAYVLEQSVVKLMRGLLTSMMKQSAKVETFKHTLNPLDALHAKYDTQTGDIVVADDAWGHLQLDATSLFLLMLAQMTASGLRIVFTLDEVNFVQNLVHYISRAYLTPDFGLWERGAKSNGGNTEINASSVGMVKAALEAMRGFNLFGSEGEQASVVHVVEDDIANARETLEALLPRESASKEIDAALLSIIGYPAYAIENPALVEKTRGEIVDKLQGKYGCKRFLRDGHQTVLEDHHRLHYEAGELQIFEHIESEWPLFFTYLLIDSLMRGDKSQTEFYQRALEPLFIERDGQQLLPELYYVPKEAIDAERQNPGSQTRLANDNLPLVWAQSLSILSDLLQSGYLKPADLDPLGRSLQTQKKPASQILITVLAETDAVKNTLKTLGLKTQTPQEIAPIKVATSAALVRAFCEVGKNTKLGLSGRPKRALDTLTTSQLYKLHGEEVIFLPPFLHGRYSYFQLDNHFLVQQIRSELAFVHRHWLQPQPPLVTLLISESMLNAVGSELLTALLQELDKGLCDGIPTRVKRLDKHLPVCCRESINYLHDFRIQNRELASQEPRSRLLQSHLQHSTPVAPQTLALWRSCNTDEELFARLNDSRNIYEQIELLTLLIGRHGEQHPTPFKGTLRQLVEDLYPQAAEWRLWGVMRRCAALLNWYDERLEEELARLVLRGLRVAVGRAYSKDVLIERPLDNLHILERIKTFGGDDPRVRLLLQELVLLLGKLAKLDPQVFKNTYTLQCWHLLLLLNVELALAKNLSEGEAFDALLELNPQELQTRLHRLLTHTQDSISHLAKTETLQLANPNEKLVKPKFIEADNPNFEKNQKDWLSWRKHNGGVIRLTDEFFARLWQHLSQCAGLVIGDRLNSQSRLDSQIVRADMTPAERNFRLLIEDKMNLIHAPEYRQLVIEAIQVLLAILEANPTLTVNNFIVLDVFIGHAVRLHWFTQHDAVENSNQPYSNAEAWQMFFNLPPNAVANALVASFDKLIDEHADDSESQPIPAENVI